MVDFYSTTNQTNVVFSDDFSNNPATALTVGSSSALVFGRQLPTAGQAANSNKYSVASVQLTAPQTCLIAHRVQSITGLRYAASGSLAAPPVIVDVHTVVFDKVVATPTLGYADPNFLIKRSCSVTWKIPRLQADSPTNQNCMDDYLRVGVLTNVSSMAGFIKLANWES